MTVPPAATVTFYPLPDLVRPSWRRRGGVGLAVAGLHLGGLLVAFGMVTRPVATQPPSALEVRVIEAASPALPAPSQPRVSSAPAKPPSIPRSRPSVAVPPAKAAAAMPVAAPPTSARQTEERPLPAAEALSATAGAKVPAAPVLAATAPWQPARFDAAYLHNPHPPYPEIARRLGQQGRVTLRVRVSAQGKALAVELHQSSGFSRLDEAARAAVERWRFAPARRGDDAVESSVLVPVQFDLRTDGDQ